MGVTRALTAAGCALCLALASSALAKGLEPPASGSMVYPGSSLGGIAIQSANDDNDLSVHYDPTTSRFTVRDTAGASGCDQIDPSTVSCPAVQTDPMHFLPEVSLEARRGDDRASFAASIPGTITVLGGAGADTFEVELGGTGRARLSGHLGGDELVGGSADDSAQGAEGADRLLGRAGDDNLVGGSGRDSLLGGPGDDRLNASRRGHDPDRDIRCGTGTDVAVIDRDLDPRPVGCEQVKAR